MGKLRMTLPKEFIDFCYTRGYKWTQEDIVACKEMLSRCDPNARERGYYKRTALHYHLPFEIVEWLVERGADVNASANSYGTPLFNYARIGDYNVCKFLIACGADVNMEDYAGQTALFGAACKGHVNIIMLLLEHGADPCHHARNFRDSFTPLLNMLSQIQFAPTEEEVYAAELLVKAQQEQGGIPDEEWQKAQKFIADIGHRFALYKSRKENYHEEHELAINQLYALFCKAGGHGIGAD